MRKISLVLLSIGALLALSIYWQGPASADGPLGAPPDGFGKKVAGVSLSWGTLTEFNGYPVDPPVPWSCIATLSADGTGMVWADAAYDSALGFRGPQHVAWKRIGQRQILIKHLVFNYAPGPDPPAGTLVSISRNTGFAEFNPEFTEYGGTWSQETFTPEQMLGEDLEGPGDPNYEGEPIGTMSGEYWGTALEVRP